MIYCDHAATSFPKAAAVPAAMTRFLVETGGNPGRSAHRLAAAAARTIYAAREAVAALLGGVDARRVIFAPNATTGLNLALRGLLRPGDHVVTTSLEHNAVMRPLRCLREERGVRVSVVAAGGDGRVDPAALAAAVTPATRLVVVNHGSNVLGTVAPLSRIRAALPPGVPLLVDAAQTLGAWPLDVARDGVDLLAFTGHKALGGPPGTGGLWLGPGIDPDPLVVGGTGSNSTSDEVPAHLPDRYEGGTPNGPGIAGLGAALAELQAQGGPAATAAHERALLERLLDGLAGAPRVRVHGPADREERLATVSVTIDGRSPSEVGFLLERRHDILVRVGLHCAPEAHRSIGTFPAGTVRLAFGRTNTAAEVDAVAAALREIGAEAAP
jgi:cysteine desulfurase family protein